jgi:hypothetical protein
MIPLNAAGETVGEAGLAEGVGDSGVRGSADAPLELGEVDSVFQLTYDVGGGLSCPV